MFGIGVHTAQIGTRMVIQVPVNWIGAILCLPGVLIFISVCLRTTVNAKRVSLVVFAILFFYGFFLYSSTTTLDRANRMATVRQFWFWHVWTRQVPLNTVDSFYVRTGDFVGELRMQLTNGSVTSISLKDTDFTRSKEKAAYKANQFLGTPNAGNP